MHDSGAHRTSRALAWLGRRSRAARSGPGPSLDRSWVRKRLADCAAGAGGEASARSRVAELAAAYRALDDAGRRAFLELVAEQGRDDDDRATAPLARAWLEATGVERQLAATRLRAALAGSPMRILREFNFLPEGVKFLVDLRADAIRLSPVHDALRVVSDGLYALFQDWFALGNLELRRITWQSPAALLERLMAYEAVHEIRSWLDLRHRLESDRRCYAFFHPRMPQEPLVFVEVALTPGIATAVAPLLDEAAPAVDPREATTAVFYSISSTQPGLRGVPFGGFLIKRVVADLVAEYPRLSTFVTLSPVPGFRRWLEGHPEGAPAATPAAGEDSGEALTALCAYYLVTAKRSGRPLDPVARFHFSNGARLDRVNWRADASPRGLAQSFGIMVNYRYEPADIEDNHEAYSRDGRLAVSSGVRRLLRKGPETD
ncbi:MAG: malonyl-CoA decarboxylase family protein [Proteobacteria bacterium]|jgi:malonyl-CoA decarboxylase|nr:malonyl-CoA decarboxylase family protein [Pseudomonadota bacterium]